MQAAVRTQKPDWDPTPHKAVCLLEDSQTQIQVVKGMDRATDEKRREAQMDYN